ncbi:protein SOB FIVE-LIKE 5-like [Rhodamnia argentea]|uniref:Protein SOB FIVE-LIKE 5-like n=1 Tax=Rhodamnia argentea TaxID=178133 RepID=A0A8B8PUK3_9MYRT|nr:protein SOB FIVE-LIKE 5-like [Rhodamnia argentea]
MTSGSGCESGWTFYLYGSSFSSEKVCGGGGGSSRILESFGVKEEEGGGDSLSMVSDASSGPPCYYVDEPSLSSSSACGKKRSKKPESAARRGHSCFEDTATSPQLNSPKKSLTNLSKNQVSASHVWDPSDSYSVDRVKGKHRDSLESSQDERVRQLRKAAKGLSKSSA